MGEQEKTEQKETTPAVKERKKVYGYVWTHNEALGEKMNLVKRLYGKNFNEDLIKEGIKTIMQSEHYKKQIEFLRGKV